MQIPTVKLLISTPTLRTNKTNPNLINTGEGIEHLRISNETIITHSNIKVEPLDKYSFGLHINNIGT